MRRTQKARCPHLGSSKLPYEARAALLAWFDSAKREMPWRETNDPYVIWVSEVMLQQTQVATATDYFNRWMTRFPTVHHLARADEQQVLGQWQGLGYYRRCRQLLIGARQIAEQGWPTSAKEWRQVPGVGPYTAGAIASIALGQPEALVDGNVERVFARLTANTSVAGAWDWARNNLDQDHPGEWNQALMELGATICTYRRAKCGQCPVSAWCAGKSEPEKFPAPRVKPTAVHLERNAVICTRKGDFGLEQIPEGEWWHGMWRFPTESRNDDRYLGSLKHAVTHHRINLRIWHREGEGEGLSWFDREQLSKLPMPAPQRKALKLYTPLLDL